MLYYNTILQYMKYLIHWIVHYSTYIAPEKVIHTKTQRKWTNHFQQFDIYIVHSMITDSVMWQTFMICSGNHKLTMDTETIHTNDYEQVNSLWIRTRTHTASNRSVKWSSVKLTLFLSYWGASRFQNGVMCSLYNCWKWWSVQDRHQNDKSDNVLFFWGFLIHIQYTETIIC